MPDLHRHPKILSWFKDELNIFICQVEKLLILCVFTMKEVYRIYRIIKYPSHCYSDQGLKGSFVNR